MSKVVLTRLPVGHSHADIDAHFAKIWRAVRNKHVLTPTDYSRIISSALQSKNKVVEVADIWALPNYKLLMDPLVDKKFGTVA